jgi:hypothetical protein
MASRNCFLDESVSKVDIECSWVDIAGGFLDSMVEDSVSALGVDFSAAIGGVSEGYCDHIGDVACFGVC